MTQEDFANIIRLVRRAPLANMDEAEAAAVLMQKFAGFVLKYQQEQEEKQTNGHDKDTLALDLEAIRSENQKRTAQ